MIKAEITHNQQINTDAVFQSGICVVLKLSDK